jgi:SAM-dependent MidA family methyltransferase
MLVLHHWSCCEVYVGQEILDAFPVYQFVKTDGAWREKMVDVDFEPDSPLHFRYDSLFATMDSNSYVTQDK